MNVKIIGSTQYLEKMKEHAYHLRQLGHEVILPIFDGETDTALQIAQANLRGIRWADEVQVFWDQRSMGTVFDFGMCIALEKKVTIIHMEQMTFRDMFMQYEYECIGKEQIPNGYRAKVGSAPHMGPGCTVEIEKE